MNCVTENLNDLARVVQCLQRRFSDKSAAGALTNTVRDRIGNFGEDWITSLKS
jgi:hypothetical protein